MTKHKIISIILMFATVVIFSPLAHAAFILGQATYRGAVPEFKEIKMDADPICLTKHEGKVFPDTLVLGEDNGMANVFVYIKKGLPKKDYPAPTTAVSINQKGCVYSPHVLGVMTGQPIKFLNPDGTLHNVHALTKVNPEFNLAMPKFRKETTKVFGKAEFMFPIKCDVHPWMETWVAVMDHPYFDVTATNGRYSIEDLPAGTYEIVAWHEKLGTQTATVSLKDQESSAEVHFTFSR